MKKLCVFLALIIFLCSLSFAQSSGNPPAGHSSKAEAASRTVYTAPYSQNFGGAWLPADWTAENYWSQYNSNWARCWFDLGNVTETTGLYSPLINIPGYMYRLNFRWSHWLNPTYTNDMAWVRVRVNGAWETVWQRLQNDFNSNDGASVNAPGSGVLESIDLTRFSGHVIQIMFEGFSGGGASWFVDDFSVSYLDTGINSYPNLQDFSSATFPPPYWRNPNFSPYWRRSGVNAYGVAGQGSAMDSDNWDTGSTTVLESPFLNLGIYGGTLSFDHAYAHYAPYEPAHKDLQILVSYNGGQSFSVLQTYSGETVGSLVTALPVSGVFNPSGSQWATKTLQIPPGVNLLRFQSLNQYGSGDLFLDNLKFEKRNFPAGNGTAGDPYQIFSASQLSNVRLYLGSAYANTHFKLMADLDLLAYLSAGGEGYAAWGTSGWLALGNSASPFCGSFDGNNHTISNLRSSSYGPNHGLFGVTAAGSTVKNLNLASTCAILGDAETGSIVGKNNGIIRNCSSAAAVNIGRAEQGGGISGNNTGSIFNSRFTGSVSRSGSDVNSNKLGGIAGNNETGAVIDSCFANASIAGGTWNGGLAGWNNGIIVRSHSSGTLSCYGNTTGGLVGQNNGNINNSYSRSNVSGASYVGGLVGYNNGGSVTNCYSTGIPSASGPRGGLSGYGNTGITGCYWDIQTSGIASSFGGTGKTTAEMKQLSTYVMWDFAGETANGISNFWNMSLTDNSGYPFLTFELAPELRPALPLAPAHLSTGLPQSGFELSWAQGSQAVLPVSYNIILRKGYGDPGNYDLYSEIHTFPGILGTTFNPVSQGGFSFDYSNNTAYWWGWNVQSVGADGSTAMSQMFVFWIENDPALLISPDSPLLQNFAGTAFPPSGWTLSPVGQTWSRHLVNAYGNPGEGSAKADFYSYPPGAEFDLITPLFRTEYPSMQLSFDYAYASYPWETQPDDQLEILYSTDRTTFQSLIVYTGGENGSLVTAPLTSAEFVPGPTQWGTKTIMLPAATKQLKFRALSAHGNNLYVDNLKVEVFSFYGNGTASNPFQIRNAWDLWSLTGFTGSQNANLHYKLINDIDLTEFMLLNPWGDPGWEPIGTAASPFFGQLDGNGKVISNFYCYYPGIGLSGLFGCLGTGASIQNLGLEIDPAYSVSGELRTGGLVGWNKGSLSGCYVTGSVICSGNSAGGLVGQNEGTISNCYSRASVSGVNNVGGLTGYQNEGGSLNSSFATGSVSSSGSPVLRGGLLGAIDSGFVSNSYWDVQTTGQATSSGSDSSFGKTTAQMQTQATFSGWDFSSVWFIHPDSNNGYPQLLWIGIPAAPNTPTNPRIVAGSTPGMVLLTWDDMLAPWYGIYAGSDPQNLSYLGWTASHSLSLPSADRGFYKVTAGSGTAPGAQLSNP